MDTNIKSEMMIEVTLTPTVVNPNAYPNQVIVTHGHVNQPHEMFVPTERDNEDMWMKEMTDEENGHEESDTHNQTDESLKCSLFDPANWKRVVLSEEEAIDKFNKRASEPKYVNARFKCTDCFTNFAREDKLKKHIMINHSEAAGDHICLFCRRRFQKPCKLRMHIKKHYFQIECLRCNLTFSGEGLAFQHENFHRGVVIKCKYCSHEFRHKSTYYQHVRTQHRSSHVCALCGASFCSRAGLNVHKRRLHQHDKEVETQSEQYIFCKKCEMKFANIEAYNEHYRHSTLHADGVDSSYNVMAMPEEQQNDNDNKDSMYVRCAVCHEVFYSYSSCLRHHRSRHPAQPFMQKLPARAAGADSGKVNCDICGALIKATSLYTHMNAHTRNRVYKCDVCQMEFPYPTSLLRHKVTHTGEKKYPCSLCSRRFTQRNSMKLHYRTFHLKEPYPKRNRKKKTQNTTQDQINLNLML